MIINKLFKKHNTSERLWNTNFSLLWQAQLISSSGDVFYEIALGFWVLTVTGSTAIMACVVAVSTVPKIIISPFAGVIVDRFNKKYILIISDLIRGICIAALGISAYLGFSKLWMVYTSGIIIGFGTAFFSPSINALIPEIVDSSKLMKSNSSMNLVYTLTQTLGNSIGGFIYQYLGGPFIFLFNGLSYLFSAFLSTFIKLPKFKQCTLKQNILIDDFKDGIKFIWNFKGLKILIFIACCLNFFASAAYIMLLPLFKETPNLGVAKYGVAIGIMTGGNFAGMLFTSIKNIAYEKRFIIFMVSAMIDSIFCGVFPFINNFNLALLMLFAAGFSNSLINMFILSSIQQSVPDNMRGKVFSIVSTVSQGLTPISIAIAGIISEFVSIKYIIFVCYAINIFIFLPFVFIKKFINFINYNPVTQTLEDIL